MTQNPTNALYWKKRHQAAADEALESYKRWSALRDAAVEVLKTVDGPEGSPDHAHQNPGRWDANGRECVECRIWNRLRSLVA